MQVIVYIKSDVARQLQQRRSTKASRELRQAARKLGVELEPMHPGVDDPNLQSYFTADVPNDRAEEVISTLRNLSAVDGAYTKPMEEYS